ncbi:hypothetical protein PybrP1_001008 [[Pythium] brassicae (nom. inval.)]|nr:hypothetical protein PybrP1_001008 [[Pythium] brassicae (nom. inval.)]
MLGPELVSRGRMDGERDGRGGGPPASAAGPEAASASKVGREEESVAPHVTAPIVMTPKQVESPRKKDVVAGDAGVSPNTAAPSGDNGGETSQAGRSQGENEAEIEAVAPESPRFEPLRSQWRYGLAVFARYKRTPYFYSGNIATYLGAGLFMVVFDDGTLNYRVKREDIVLRFFPSSPDGDSDECESSAGGTDSSFSGERRNSSPSRARQSPLKLAHLNWHSNSSILYQNYTMVDFSITPPRQLSLCDGERDLLSDELLGMKRLECGVGYEDDSTQVSDSDESSEEDMSMTPWQQMTQTFGMGKIRPRASRRSSISSLSQVDRLSITHKGMAQILPSPKGLKQTIQEFLSRKTKKVQPASVGGDVVALEHLRLMETRARELAAKYESDPAFSTRVVVAHSTDGGGDVRRYGTIKARLPGGALEVITEDEQMISVQVLSPESVELLPSVNELHLQMRDLVHASKTLYAGRKVQVNLYPGSRFSGPGVVTLEVENDTTFNVLLRNRIRLVNVPADKLVPLREKKKAAATITEDQFLVCSGKAKVYIGDQVFVKCEGDYEGVLEEKVGILNGVFSNKTAAVDFADGSTGYEVAPALITKRKRPKVSADTDLMSLKNAVLMQASGAGDGGGGEPLEVGFHVKADHPRKASVETCVVIKKHPSAACDVRFSDGTIAFEVFPSQMILDTAGSAAAAADACSAPAVREAFPGEYVLAWSSRFGRYCSAKVAAKTGEGVSALYTIVFDYGEQKANVPLEKLAPLERQDALSPTQKLTNYSIDTIGFEISPVAFAVGEAVAARVHGSVQYYSGWVEAVQEKERLCAVQFDSSERDEHVPFSAMFSVDVRNRFQSVGNRLGSSSGGASRLSHFQDEGAMAAASAAAAADDLAPANRRRRHSGGSVGSIIMSVAGSIFRPRKEGEQAERRRGSHLITEIGAVLRRRPDP